MNTHTTGTNHRKYEPDLGAFDKYRTQFRQYLLERNYVESTIGSYLRCIGGLVELMKVEGVTFGELDEAQAVGLVAKTGWTQRRKIYATFIMSRFVRFLAERGVGKPALPPTAKEIARTELRRDYSDYRYDLWHAAGRNHIASSVQHRARRPRTPPPRSFPGTRQRLRSWSGSAGALDPLCG